MTEKKKAIFVDYLNALSFASGTSHEYVSQFDQLPIKIPLEIFKGWFDCSYIRTFFKPFPANCRILDALNSKELNVHIGFCDICSDLEVYRPPTNEFQPAFLFHLLRECQQCRFWQYHCTNCVKKYNNFIQKNVCSDCFEN